MKEVRAAKTCLVHVLAVALFVAVAGCDGGPPRQESAEILQRLGVAFKMYANESKGEKWPPMGTGADMFRPDMRTLGAYIKDDQELGDYLSGKTGVEICYLGHLAYTERMALNLLDIYADQGLERARDQDVEYMDPSFSDTCTDSWPGYRLREGIERFLITDIGNPAGSSAAQAQVPVLWELPPEKGTPYSGGSWVLFMDGHTEFRPFLGTFPMKREVADRVREMRKVPEKEWKTLAEARRNSPVRQAIQPLLDCGIHVRRECRHHLAPPFPCGPYYSYPVWSLVHCDLEPSVAIEGRKGYRVDLRTSPVRRDEKRTPANDPIHLSLMLFPQEQSPSRTLLGEIEWGRFGREDKTCALDLGRGSGYRWFGRGAPAYLKSVQNHLDLWAGYSRCDELVKWLSIHRVGRSRTASLLALAQFGEEALPFLAQEVQRGQKLRPEETAEILASIPGARAGELLCSLCKSHPECRNASLAPPRKECEDIYLDMLRSEAEHPDRRRHLGRHEALVEAAARFCGAEARPLLASLRASGASQLALDGWPEMQGLRRAAVEKPARRLSEWNASRGFTPAQYAQLQSGQFLDFDTHRVFETPISIRVGKPDRAAQWLRKSGCDLLMSGGLHWLDATRFPLLGRREPPAEERDLPFEVFLRFKTYRGAEGVAHITLDRYDRVQIEYVLATKTAQWGLQRWDETPEPPGILPDLDVPHFPYLTRTAQAAVVDYARTHGGKWPDTLEQVLDTGLLDPIDRKAFLLRFEYEPLFVPMKMEQWPSKVGPWHWVLRPYVPAVFIKDRGKE